MIHGIRYVRQDISYISKKHYCPICNTLLDVVKVSKVINSNSEETKELPPILPKTVIGRGVKFRNYNAVGNIKWIWKQFECPNCKHHFTVDQMKQIESSPKENWEELISSFDEPAPYSNNENLENKKSKSKLKLILLITIPTAIFLALAIGLIIMFLTPSDFVDTNGPENFALVELTREEIMSSDKKYRASMESIKSSGARTYVVGTKFREYDCDCITASFGKIHGFTVIQATKIFDNTLTLNINSSVEKGNAEIIITVEGEYYCSVPVNQNQSITLQDISGKEIIVKLAGEDAKVKVNIVRSY